MISSETQKKEKEKENLKVFWCFQVEEKWSIEN